MIEINLRPDSIKIDARSKKAGNNINTKYVLYAVPAILGLLIFLHFFLAIVTIKQNNQLRILKNKWQALGPKRETLDEFRRENLLSAQGAKAVQQLIQQKIDWARKLNSLSLGLPSGIWFRDISASAKDLTLQGSVISLQNDEMKLISTFIDNLKNDAGFMGDFKNIELNSVQKRTISGYDIADFTLISILKTK